MSDETDHEPETPGAEGEVLFYEPGGSWWVVTIGPLLCLALLIVEIAAERHPGGVRPGGAGRGSCV